MKNKNYILFVFLVLAKFALAQPKGFTKVASASDFKSKLEAAANKTESIDSKFTQTKHLSFISEELKNEGQIYFKKENFLRWEYTEPYAYVIVINNGKMTIKDEDKVSNFDLQSSEVFQKVNDMILNSVQGNALDDKLYYIEIYQNSKHFLVEMKPKEAGMKEFIEEIHLYFNKTDYSVDQVKMLEPMGDYTLIAFHHKKLNTAIPNEKFTIH